MKVDLGTIIEDLKLMKGRQEQMRVELAKDSELVVNSWLIIAQLQQENTRLVADNAELRHHLNPAPDGPITDAEAPFKGPSSGAC